jgi:hypothetical protein
MDELLEAELEHISAKWQLDRARLARMRAALEYVLLMYEETVVGQALMTAADFEELPEVVQAKAVLR